MENTEMILEGMIAIQQNELESLMEALTTAKWSYVDQAYLRTVIDKHDANIEDDGWKPVIKFSKLTTGQKLKLAKKFKLKKIGAVAVSSLIGAGVGAAMGANSSPFSDEMGKHAAIGAAAGAVTYGAVGAALTSRHLFKEESCNGRDVMIGIVKRTRELNTVSLVYESIKKKDSSGDPKLKIVTFALGQKAFKDN